MYLPDEILELIFSYLNLKTLSSLRDIAEDVYLNKLMDYHLVNDILVTPSGASYAIGINAELRKLLVNNVKNFYFGLTTMDDFYHLDNKTIFNMDKGIVYTNIDDLIVDSNPLLGTYILVKGNRGEIYKMGRLIKTINLPIYKKIIIHYDVYNDQIYIYLLDKKGDVWILNNDTFLKINIQNVVDITYAYNFYALDRNEKIYQLIEDKSEAIISPPIIAFMDRFFITEDLSIYNPINHSVNPFLYKGEKKDPFEISSSYKTTFYLCDDGRLYIDTDGREIVWVDLSDYE